MKSEFELTEKKQKSNRLRRGILIFVVVLFIGIFAGGWNYLNDYYKADEYAQASVESTETVEVCIHTEKGNYITFEPVGQAVEKGIVFYPGGKVEYTAYAPLMKSLAEQGIMCVLYKMPFNLAVFDYDAADGIMSEYPEIEDWYIAGHSHGGSFAGKYLSELVNAGESGKYKGIILLGAYIINDLSASDMRALCIYGSEDQVMALDKYQENLVNLPSDYEEYVIEGGCHAYFGAYGAQEGDGVPTITNNEQVNETARRIAEFCYESNK